MPWGWDTRGPVDVALGGNKGTPEEAKVAHAWPAYEARYLEHRLNTARGKYNSLSLEPAQEYVYLDKITEDYKQEADECLRQEFNDWLQGKHSANLNETSYENEAGKPVRRKVIKTTGGSVVSEPWNPEADGKWNPTWWGEKQLTHLPGVRNYLRENEEHRMKNELHMNLLAEFGPQDIEQAWMYFKHWVKGRPVGPETCPDLLRSNVPGDRADFGHMPPQHFPVPPRKPPSSGGTPPSSSSGGTTPSSIFPSLGGGSGSSFQTASSVSSSDDGGEILRQILYGTPSTSSDDGLNALRDDSALEQRNIFRTNQNTFNTWRDSTFAAQITRDMLNTAIQDFQ